MELSKIQQARREQTLDLAARLSDDPNPQLFWWETLNAKNSRVWLVQDPPDGQSAPNDGRKGSGAPRRVRRRGDRADVAPPTPTKTAVCTINASRAACRDR